METIRTAPHFQLTPYTFIHTQTSLWVLWLFINLTCVTVTLHFNFNWSIRCRNVQTISISVSAHICMMIVTIYCVHCQSMPVDDGNITSFWIYTYIRSSLEYFMICNFLLLPLFFAISIGFYFEHVRACASLHKIRSIAHNLWFCHPHISI